jgi:2-dehydro-3-deoxygluconokinase
MIMGKEFDLLSYGEVLLRLSPEGHERLDDSETFTKRVGGAELNVATGVAMLGLRTGIISKLPSNPLGTFAKNRIRFSGVSDDYIVYDDSKEARLGLYYYEIGRYPRKPSVVYDRANTSFSHSNISDYPESMYASTKLFHVSGVTLALCEETRNTAIEMIHKFKEAGALISFDVNFRGNLWTGDEARECIEKFLPYVDIFFCSEDTARLTFGKTGTAEEIMKSFTEEYPISIVASTQRIVHSPKHHTFGSVIYSRKTDTFYKEDPYVRIQVVDRIGSGDAYCSGVLYALLSEPDNFQRAVEFGNAQAAVKNTIPGDMPGSDLEEIQSVIEDHHNTGYQSEMKR